MQQSLAAFFSLLQLPIAKLPIASVLVLVSRVATLGELVLLRTLLTAGITRITRERSIILQIHEYQSKKTKKTAYRNSYLHFIE